MLRLEEGKYYRTPTGIKVGPMEVWAPGANHGWQIAGGSNDFDSGGDIWKGDGTSDYDCPVLVSEWGDKLDREIINDMIETLEWVRKNYAAGSTAEINHVIDETLKMARGEQ